MTNNDESKSPTNKVERIMQRRGIEELGEVLEQKWMAEGQQGAGVREIAKFFNMRILEEALADAGIVPLNGELESMYQQLSENDEDTTSGIRVRERLSNSGIDASKVTADFISHQTMYRYLTDVREVKKETNEPTLQSRKRSIKNSAQKLQSRLRSVVASNLQSLSKKDGFYIGDIEVTVSMTVTCRICGTSRSLSDTLVNNGCEC